MKEDKQILVSLDYELFLGKNSGTVDNCIINPTNRLLKILEPHHINAIFFIDTIYLIKLKEKSIDFPLAKQDYLKIENQLKLLLEKGHYLFPHIHAHWMDAIYHEDSNTWNLSNFSRYRFHDVEDSLKDKLFHDSIQFLKDLIMPINGNYIIDSYRAGGWCIQPFDDFKPYFEKYNIINDFSVVRGLVSHSHLNFFDYRCDTKLMYSFHDDVIKESDGKFSEFTVSSIPTGKLEGLFYKLESKILWVLRIKNFGDGNSIKFHTEKSRKGLPIMLSIDTLLLSIFQSHYNLIKKQPYIHFASHPKMLSVYNIFLFKYLLKYTVKKYNVISDFREIKSTMQPKANHMVEARS